MYTEADFYHRMYLSAKRGERFDTCGVVLDFLLMSQELSGDNNLYNKLIIYLCIFSCMQDIVKKYPDWPEEEIILKSRSRGAHTKYLVENGIWE